LPTKADGTAYAENDSLSLGESVGPVRWEFDKLENGELDRENGWVNDGTNRIRFENMETVNTRDGDIVDGVVQTSAQDAIPAASPISTIAQQLSEDYSIVQDRIAERASSGTLTPDDISLGKVLSQSGTPKIFVDLNAAGVSELILPEHDAGDPMSRTRAAISAGVESIHAHNLPLPDSEYLAERDMTGISGKAYKIADNIGGKDNEAYLESASQAQQPSIYEDDYDAAYI